MSWIGNLARIIVLFQVSLAALGCAAQQPAPDAPPSLGIVRDVLGLELSDSPGSPIRHKIGGNVALVVESHATPGPVWNRLIASDGTYGWTSAKLAPASPVEVRPFAKPFVLMSKSPDDEDFSENAQEIPITDEMNGKVLGASMRIRPVSARVLMVPERLRLNQTPWLHLRFGSHAGYAPLDWVTLTWSLGTADNSTPDSSLDAAGMRGVMWRPFLGAVAPRLMELAPQRGSNGYVVDKATVAAQQTPLPAAWDGIEMVYRQGGTALLAFSSGSSRLFLFMKNGAVTSDLFAPDYEPYAGTVLYKDLNADGSPEWMLEVISIYGDGYFSSLWVLDGKSRRDALKLAQLPLSSSSGEEDAQIDAEWEVAADGTLRVTRTSGKNRKMSPYRYTDRLRELRN